MKVSKKGSYKEISGDYKAKLAVAKKQLNLHGKVSDELAAELRRLYAAIKEIDKEMGNRILPNFGNYEDK